VGVTGLSAVWLLLVTNFIGVVFARSLHYQFYVWYWHALPFLLHVDRRPFPVQLGTGVYEWGVVVGKVAVLMMIELCWNVYPAQWWSSGLLIVCHGWLLTGVMRGNGVDMTTSEAVEVEKKKKVK
jgi:alpha-1,3-mannosyltransferase